MGTTGRRKNLSFKDKLLLLRNYLDLSANPHKNRVFQQKKTLAEETREKVAAIRQAKKKRQELEKEQKDNLRGDKVTNFQYSPGSTQGSP